MTNFNEELEKILSQVLMKHHDDISSQDDDAIAEARDAITELVKGIVPKEKLRIVGDSDGFFRTNGSIDLTRRINPTRREKLELESQYEAGFNSCRTEMLRRVGMEEKCRWEKISQSKDVPEVIHIHCNHPAIHCVFNCIGKENCADYEEELKD